MPFIYLHLAVARDVAIQLRHPEVDSKPGDYLLGATLPDVHIISGGSREQTHFLSLEAGPMATGVKLFLNTYPDLTLEATRRRIGALVAGYICHLVTDETWIRDVYRPCFGPGSPLGGDPLVKLMDRALQYEMDRRERNDKSLNQVRELVRDWEATTDAPFIDRPTLCQWQQIVCDAANRDVSWEGFRLFARKFLIPRHALSPEQLDQFLASPSAMLGRIFSVVSEARLAEFRNNAVAGSVAATREYLC